MHLTRFGSLWRVDPVSREWGFDRGLPIDRFYIESFLARSADKIRGCVLEIQDDEYTRRFGARRVAEAEVLDVDPGNPRATLVGDLADDETIPSDRFDCVILTQTLQLVYEVAAAVRALHRALRPGGVVLATVPGITRMGGTWRDTWFWAFSPASARRVFGDEFGPANVQVETYGNVLAATAFLHGLAAHELRPAELAHQDPEYPVTVAITATRAPAS